MRSAVEVRVVEQMLDRHPKRQVGRKRRRGAGHRDDRVAGVPRVAEESIRVEHLLDEHRHQRFIGGAVAVRDGETELQLARQSPAP